ncbi:MAG: DUF2852 domain-containing protein [Pseudomonadota bacterium]
MEQAKEMLLKVRDGLDHYGFGAWIAAMVVGFIVFLPIGLGVLGYMIWSGRMGCRGRSARWRKRLGAGGETGNAAFDAYRAETLKRLEEERQAFAEFMERLRKAKDEAEFEQFMRERGQTGGQTGGQAASSGGASGGPSGPAPSGGFGPSGGFTPQPAG